jgi:hypothetical protein
MTADVKRRLLVVANHTLDTEVLVIAPALNTRRGIVERARDRFTPPVEPAPGGL